MSRRVKAFVVASILLNLLLAGVVAGHAVQRLGPPLKWREAVLSQLPEPKRALYESAMKEARRQNAPLADELRRAREAVALSLTAEPFDRQAYFERVAALQELENRRKMRMAEAVAGLAEHYTPEERAILAESLRRMPPKGHKPRQEARP